MFLSSSTSAIVGIVFLPHDDYWLCRDLWLQVEQIVAGSRLIPTQFNENSNFHPVDNRINDNFTIQSGKKIAKKRPQLENVRILK